MRLNLRKAVSLILFVSLLPAGLSALTLTGNVTRDFPAESCRDGSNGRSLAMPPSFPANIISGFDAQKICLLYNRPQNTLFVGIKTFDHSVTGEPIPFGDADGDGDPSRTGPYLSAEGGADFPDLSQEEFFSLLLDFDADLRTSPEVIAGVSALRQAVSGFRVSEVALPHLGINFSFLESYYGSTIAASAASAMFGSPGPEAPHLEFAIFGFSSLPGFQTLQPDDPDQVMGFIFKAGSLGDVGTGEEDVRVFPPQKDFVDDDGDDIPNGEDLDQDNDGIPDAMEMDSDNDGLMDFEEERLGTDPLQRDTDGDGTPDKEEIDQGRNPLTPDPPSDPNTNDPEGVPQGIPGPASGTTEQFQGSGLAGCQLHRLETSDEHERDGMMWLVIGLALSAAGLYCVPRRKRYAIFFIGCLFFSRSVHAINIEHFYPPFDHLGGIRLLQSRTLPRNAFRFGFGLSYANEPAELGALGSGARSTPLVDHEISMILNAAWGAVDWATVGIAVPFSPNLILQPVGAAASYSTAAFGDMAVEAKFHIWEREETDGKMGFALSPQITFPTGSSSKYRGEANLTGALRAVYDVEYKANQWIANAGFRFREKEDLINVSIGQEFLYGLGYQRPIWVPYDLHVVTELDGSVSMNGAGSIGPHSPMEWLVGLRKGFATAVAPGHFLATLGSSLGITNGYGTPNFRVFGMISYETPPLKREKMPEVAQPVLAKVEGEKIVIFQPIHFETGQWEISSYSPNVVQAVAEILRSQPSIRHVIVEGHTDNRGSDAHNLKLSQNRALAIVKKLIEFGIEPDRLTAKGFGESQPVATNRTPEGRAKNRRTEFRITKMAQPILKTDL